MKVDESQGHDKLVEKFMGASLQKLMDEESELATTWQTTMEEFVRNNGQNKYIRHITALHTNCVVDVLITRNNITIPNLQSLSRRPAGAADVHPGRRAHGVHPSCALVGRRG